MAKATGQESIYSRLPRRDDNDDYYGFSAGQEGKPDAINTWVNRDGAFMGKPMFYVGSLKDGESVDLLVTFQEQDNKAFESIKTPLVTALGLAAAATAAFPLATGILSAATVLAGQLPDNKSDDVLGGFVVRVSNKGGVLTKTWIPTPQITVAKGTATTTMDNYSSSATSTADVDVHHFDMAATSSGVYAADAMVRTATNAQTYEDRPLVYLGEENDACGSDNLTLGGVRFPKLDPDVPKGIDVSLGSGGYFHWECDGTAERTRPNQATEYVIVSRRGGASNRNIHWYTFKKVAQ